MRNALYPIWGTALLIMYGALIYPSALFTWAKQRWSKP